MLLQRKVVVSQSCGGSARRGVRHDAESPKSVRIPTDLFAWKRRYTEPPPAPRTVNSPQEHRNARGSRGGDTSAGRAVVEAQISGPGAVKRIIKQ